MSTTRVLAGFVAEASRILTSLESQLSVLLAADAEDPPVGALNAVFRSAHSLKGVAALFGHDEVASLAHRIEDALDEVRHGRLKLVGRLPDALRSATAALRTLVEERGRGMSQSASRTRGEELSAELGAMCASPPPPRSDSLPGFSEYASQLTDYEMYRLRFNLGKGASLYRVHAKFALIEFGPALESLGARMRGVGEVIAVIPGEAVENSDAVALDVLVCSTEARAAIESAAGANLKVTVQHSPYHTNVQVRPDAVDGISSPDVELSIALDQLDSLMTSVGELVVVRRDVERLTGAGRRNLSEWAYNQELKGVARALDKHLSRLEQGLISVRMVPLTTLFDTLARLVDQLRGRTLKSVRLEVHGQDVRLDRSIVEQLMDPLMHLVRNAIDHGIEAPPERRAKGKPEEGRVVLRARQLANRVQLEVEDDGAGLNPETIAKVAVAKGVIPADRLTELSPTELGGLIFHPGLSTRATPSEISGRGVGLDVAKASLNKLMAVIDVESKFGVGTRFTITVPLTLAILQATIVEAGGQTYALPSSVVLGFRRDHAVKSLGTTEVIEDGARALPILRLARVFGHPETDGTRGFVIIIGIAQRRFGLVVDIVHGNHNVIAKPLAPSLAHIPGLAGTTEFAGHRTVLVLDTAALLKELGATRQAEEPTFSAISQHR